MVLVRLCPFMGGSCIGFIVTEDGVPEIISLVVLAVIHVARVQF